MTATDVTEEVLARFRAVQRLAYTWAAETEATLEVGMTERDVTEALAQRHRAAGVDQVFHEPFAWFGARTMLGPDWAPDGAEIDDLSVAGLGRDSAFFATETALAHGMPVIVDLAPVVDGAPSDIGYSCILGENPVYDELVAGLEPMRAFLLEGVRRGDSLRSLYRALDEVIADHGWENCHQHYPARALGHLVMPLAPDPDHDSPIPGFGTAAAEALLTSAIEAAVAGTCSPIWNDLPEADHPPTPGLWAVEPHIGRDGVGAKWEEILVVTDRDAFWLDDDLPHHRKWRGEAPLPV
jgi:hypothetical protein